VAATIATGGRLRPPTTLRGDRQPARRATPARVARIVRSQMRTVVRSGTGMAAAVPGLSVAGKTGTAELRTTVPPAPAAADPALPTPVDDPSDTDAWFAGFAPVRKARVAVAVLLVGAGAGGASAAPVAREVLAAGA
jgi:cell division protein FtsI/penicillin-binding protein 2